MRDLVNLKEVLTMELDSKFPSLSAPSADKAAHRTYREIIPVALIIMRNII